MEVKIFNRGFFYRGENGQLCFKPLFLVCSNDKCVEFETYDDANLFGKISVFFI